MINKIIIFTSILLIGATTLSCQKKSTLEYGSPTDLEKIDWEKQNLDNLFSKIVYSKKITYKKSDSVYTGKNPLKIQWYFNYNVVSSLPANQIDGNHFKIIQSGENFLKPYQIYRTYVGVSNEALEKKGAFGYYMDKKITFNKVETISSGKEDLALIRFNTEIENDSKKALEEYNILKDILSKKFKDMKMSVNSLNEYPIYEWKSDQKKVKITLSKGELSSLNKDDQSSKEIYTIFLEIIFYNDKTKEYLRGL